MNTPMQAQLKEYVDNVFVKPLPSVLSIRETLEALQSLPHFDPHERHYPATLRKHCVLRLARMFAPMGRQALLAEQIDMVIRQGYVGRDVNELRYLAHLQDGAERIERGVLEGATSVSVECTAMSVALAGCSGAGKSQTVERSLARYPQVIRHTSPFSISQIVWIKLDCPIEGSLKSLCINFFAEVDRLLGTDYLKQYGNPRYSKEWMLLRMAQIARLHAVGLLVIDEIQNLKDSKAGAKTLLHFLVRLINTIGIPVFLIGTLGAIPLLQENFRQGRRSTGVGSAIWDRLPNGEEWDKFVANVWTYQWTSQPTTLTEPILEVLYDECQGIVDLLVKLLMLCQLRAISLGTMRRNFTEELSPALIRQVARDHFMVIRPMIEALRANNEKDLEKFDDLAPLKFYVDHLIAAEMGSSPTGDARGAGSSHYLAAGAANNASTNAGETSIADKVSHSLIRMGVAADVAAAVVNELKSSVDEKDPLTFLAAAVDRLRQPTGLPKPSRKPSQPKADPPPARAADDLREIVRVGAAQKATAYDSLRNAGVIGLPLIFNVA
jgi:hypothetical protein